MSLFIFWGGVWRKKSGRKTANVNIAAAVAIKEIIFVLFLNLRFLRCFSRIMASFWAIRSMKSFLFFSSAIHVLNFSDFLTSEFCMASSAKFTSFSEYSVIIYTFLLLIRIEVAN